MTLNTPNVRLTISKVSLALLTEMYAHIATIGKDVLMMGLIDSFVCIIFILI
jgi:hypothetical protein